MANAYIVVKEYKWEGSSNIAVFSQSHLAEDYASKLRAEIVTSGENPERILINVDQLEIDKEPT